MEHTFNLRQISKKKKRKKKEKKNRKKGRKEGRKKEREKKKERYFPKKKKKKKLVPSVVAHAFNRSIREAEADRLMCSRPAWSTQ